MHTTRIARRARNDAVCASVRTELEQRAQLLGATCSDACKANRADAEGERNRVCDVHGTHNVSGSRPRKSVCAERLPSQHTRGSKSNQHTHNRSATVADTSAVPRVHTHERLTLRLATKKPTLFSPLSRMHKKLIETQREQALWLSNQHTPAGS